MISLLVNGEKKEIGPLEGSESVTVEEMLKMLGYTHRFFAVAINRSCVPRSLFTERKVSSGDEMEILGPQQGG
jgi:thiamine biosynthesis protein ThiS